MSIRTMKSAFKAVVSTSPSQTTRCTNPFLSEHLSLLDSRSNLADDAQNLCFPICVTMGLPITILARRNADRNMDTVPE